MTNKKKAFKLTPQEFISLYQSNPKPITNEEKAMEEKKNTSAGVSKFCYDYHGNPIINNLL